MPPIKNNRIIYNNNQQHQRQNTNNDNADDADQPILAVVDLAAAARRNRMMSPPQPQPWPQPPATRNQHAALVSRTSEENYQVTDTGNVPIATVANGIMFTTNSDNNDASGHHHWTTTTTKASSNTTTTATTNNNNNTTQQLQLQEQRQRQQQQQHDDATAPISMDTNNSNENQQQRQQHQQSSILGNDIAVETAEASTTVHDATTNNTNKNTTTAIIINSNTNQLQQQQQQQHKNNPSSPSSSSNSTAGFDNNEEATTVKPATGSDVTLNISNEQQQQLGAVEQHTPPSIAAMTAVTNNDTQQLSQQQEDHIDNNIGKDNAKAATTAVAVTNTTTVPVITRNIFDEHNNNQQESIVPHDDGFAVAATFATENDMMVVTTSNNSPQDQLQAHDVVVNGNDSATTVASKITNNNNENKQQPQPQQSPPLANDTVATTAAAATAATDVVDVAANTTTTTRNRTKKNSNNPDNNNNDNNNKRQHNRLEYWNSMVERLEKYKEKHGNCQVPNRYKDDPQLGLWVQSIRGRANRGTLTSERYKLLNDLGFIWEVRKLDPWDEMFNRLVQYKENHDGDTCVPKRYKEDPKLGRWVDTQRQKEKENTLKEDRKLQLQSIGFVWVARVNDENMIQRLKTFKETYGHDDIPPNYKDDPLLSNYVADIRKNGKDKLSDSKVKKLDAINFTWVLKKHETWDTMYDRLVKYKEKHGNCDVPKNYLCDVKLSKWVQTQQDKEKSNKSLDADKKAKLDALNFTFPQKRDVKFVEIWDDMFDRLLKYKQTHGNCNVPKRFELDLKLGKWVNIQRYKNSQGVIQGDRKERLNSINFEWITRDSWDTMYEKLKQYKQKHGTCSVQQHHQQEGNEEVDAKFVKWLNKQRTSYHDLKDPSKRERLDKIGFMNDYQNIHPAKTSAPQKTKKTASAATTSKRKKKATTTIPTSTNGHKKYKQTNPPANVFVQSEQQQQQQQQQQQHVPFNNDINSEGGHIPIAPRQQNITLPPISPWPQQPYNHYNNTAAPRHASTTWEEVVRSDITHNDKNSDNGDHNATTGDTQEPQMMTASNGTATNNTHLLPPQSPVLASPFQRNGGVTVDDSPLVKGPTIEL